MESHSLRGIVDFIARHYLIIISMSGLILFLIGFLTDWVIATFHNHWTDYSGLYANLTGLDIMTGSHSSSLFHARWEDPSLTIALFGVVIVSIFCASGIVSKHTSIGNLARKSFIFLLIVSMASTISSLFAVASLTYGMEDLWFTYDVGFGWYISIAGITILLLAILNADIRFALDKSKKWRRVNILCIMGAIIGTLSFFLFWDIWGADYPPNIFDSITTWIGWLAHGGAWGDSNFLHLYISAILAVIFIVGTILAYLSPIGGFLQVSASAIYYVNNLIFYGSLNYYMGFDSAVGAIIGSMSGLISIYSWFKPFGIGYGAPLSLKEKIWNFHKATS
jgi:hypothetical protein